MGACLDEKGERVIPWGIAISAAVGLYSADQQAGAAEDAANAQQGATDAQIAEQRRQYDQTRSDQMPWLDAGGYALGQQQAFLNGDWSGFENSPDYKFAVDQGFMGLNRHLAANTGYGAGGYAGGPDADRIALGQGLATQYSNNYWNKLAGLSNTGQSTAAGLGSTGMGMANSIGNAYQNNANAQGQSAYGQADAYSQFATGLGGAVNNYANQQGWWGSY